MDYPFITHNQLMHTQKQHTKTTHKKQRTNAFICCSLSHSYVHVQWCLNYIFKKKNLAQEVFIVFFLAVAIINVKAIKTCCRTYLVQTQSWRTWLFCTLVGTIETHIVKTECHGSASTYHEPNDSDTSRT